MTKLKLMTALVSLIITGSAALDAQIIEESIGYPGKPCPNNTPIVVVQRTLQPGTWTVTGKAVLHYTDANPGHSLGVAYVADVTTRNRVRLDGFSDVTGIIFSAHEGYLNTSPKRVIRISQPTVVRLLAHTIVGTADATVWGSIIAEKKD